MNSILEFAYVNQKADKMLDFLTLKFGEVKLIEAVNTFFRFKIENNVKLSELFGSIEPNVKFYNKATKSLHLAVLCKTD